ncbi:MAG: DUF523 domain-containing protein [Gammaproteobacteria bacterium]|nr:DUF523 domain-containing protein [Gammaproteobacteria bacterium]
MTKPKIGVSRCLLGDTVRYDGRSKPCAMLNKLAVHFDLIPICPEVEAGLPIPRPPVQLSGSIEQPRLTGRDNPDIDITGLMRDYCLKKMPELDGLSGFVLKSQSPSCGLNSTPVFIEGQCVTEIASGVFARAIQASYPNLPIIEETRLDLPDARTEFIKSVSTHRTRKCPAQP